MNVSLFSSTRLLACLGALSALLCLSQGRAAAQIEGADILYTNNGGTLGAAPQEPGTPLSELFNRTTGQPFPGADYENDTGMDVTPGFDANYGNGNQYQFSKVIVQQVSLTPGLAAFYQFDGVTPVFGAGADPNNAAAPIGFWELTENQVVADAASSDPFAHALGIRGSQQLYAGDDSDPVKRFFHQHFIFTAADSGTYLFNYNVTGTLRDGTVLPTQNFTITYSSVPEPGMMALILAAAVPAAGLLRRRMRRG